MQTWSSYFPQCVRINTYHLDMDTKPSMTHLAPKASRPVSPPLLAHTTSPHNPLPSPTGLATAYLSFKIQIRQPWQRRPAYSPLFPQHLLRRTLADATITVRLHRTETSRAGTLPHLSLPPWYPAWYLAHKEAFWLFRIKDEFNILSLCFVLIYTYQFGNKDKQKFLCWSKEP